ncbi:MAG: hypothetical protein J7K20_00620 [Thermodesulfobacterium sp.]|nr:hypothetical protein [Thermodesulfobacterium sp.]
MNKHKLLKILVLCFLFCISCEAKPDINILFPKNISKLTLVQLIEGKKAIEMVNKLHGKPIDAKNAWVAYYKEISDKSINGAIIWVSEAFSSFQAKNQTESMMEKIIKSKKPFYNIQKLEGIYIFYGLGKKHAVFCKDRLVFWISADFEIFDDVLNYYKNLR